MSFQDELDAAWAAGTERRPEVYAANARMIAWLDAKNVIGQALHAGDRLPDFTLPNADGGIVSSASLLARGPLVLSVFRGGWCPFCTLELKALAQAHGEIERSGAGLVAVSPDTGTPLARAIQDNRLGFEVLSDVDQGLALALGILFRVPEELRQAYLRIGLDLGVRHGNPSSEWLLPLPATYIVDRDGVIQHAELNPDFTKRMAPERIVEFVKKMRTDAD
jgi:peroxiredoxin